MDQLLSFRSFVSAVDAGSVSAAAEYIGTTKSVVSKRISDLEAYLGARLLNRTARRLSTTNAGLEFYKQVRRILDEIKDAENQVSGLQTIVRGVLHIAAPMSFGTTHLKPVAMSLMEQHPELILNINLDDRVVDLATEGYDAAIRIGVLRDSSLVARRIAPNHHVLCGSPDYLNRHGVPRTPEDLANHNGLLYNLREPHGMLSMAKNGVMRSYRINSRMRCNNGELLLEAALAGHGLAILSTFMAHPHLRSGALQSVLMDHELPGGSISVVYVRDRHLPPKVKVLVNAMLAKYHPLPPWDRDLASLALAGRDVG